MILNHSIEYVKYRVIKQPLRLPVAMTALSASCIMPRVT